MYNVPLQRTLDTSFYEGCTKIEGTSIYDGSVLGRACVITDLSEAKNIQHGDILITHCTDIGWSPYFPLLGGIATELGGLISHGAVVAREYGLPCIVGAKSATQVFQTGLYIFQCHDIRHDIRSTPNLRILLLLLSLFIVYQPQLMRIPLFRRHCIISWRCWCVTIN